MFGRMMNESWGKVHFALTFIVVQLHVLPDAHSRRRRACGGAFYDTDVYACSKQPLQPLNQFISISAIVLGLAQFIFVVELLRTACSGARQADRNPWHSNTLEWTAPSPPPHGNFEVDPVVYRGPYEYGEEDGELDHRMQTQR